MLASLRLGLRAQIVLALSAVFLLSFALLGTAAVRLTSAAADVEQARAARLTADALGAALGSGTPDEAEAVRMLDALVHGKSVRGARLEWPAGLRVMRGEPTSGTGRIVALANGARLTLWPSALPGRAALPLANLLLFYVGITGLAVLLLTYFALTHLIVRPLDRLTAGSEQLASRSLSVRVPVAGAAEVARLATAFNHMAEQLRSERLALEQRLAELERTTVELRATQQQLVHGEKLASVGRLAAGVAHEIGNPLAAILGLVELLRAGELDPIESQEFLRRIQAETERISGIIRDLLDFSRREPEADLAGESSDLAAVVQDAVNLVRPQKESRAVEIRVTLAHDVGRVLGPQAKLTQVVLNLLLNAVDALAGKGSVEIEGTREGDAVILIVRDSGPGIRAEMMDRLFEPFTTTKPPGKGTGLGLAVSHALVEGMGGTITAANPDTGGARFEVRLRAAPAVG
ncbi:MAG TPA: ATP-binding protein [Polyangiales bacterium]|nr:ATP-binding protein [Polyangiales bacterium]